MRFTPASMSDYAALFPLAPRRQAMVAAAQLAGGLAWVLRDGDRPLLLCGLWPLAPRVLEAWLMIPPAARPSRAALRFLLDRTREVLPDSAIVARIDDENRAGHRLALLAGFEPTEEHWPTPTFRTWVRPAWIFNITTGDRHGNPDK